EVLFDDADGIGRITLRREVGRNNRFDGWGGCTPVDPSGETCILDYHSSGDVELFVSARFEWPPLTGTTTAFGRGGGSGALLSATFQSESSTARSRQELPVALALRPLPTTSREQST